MVFVAEMKVKSIVAAYPQQTGIEGFDNIRCVLRKVFWQSRAAILRHPSIQHFCKAGANSSHLGNSATLRRRACSHEQMRMMP
ncbi:hypothetical protein AN948_05320 [Rhodococcus sp. ADH]|nr:hypothetical protein AN948_05320 [Rhodococcus sp. ADH]RGP48040.1 hypothetical protein AWH04_16790 [Rhodococcus erythropolis]